MTYDHKAYMRKWLANKRAHGECVECPAKVQRFSRCKRCRERRARVERARYVPTGNPTGRPRKP